MEYIIITYLIWNLLIMLIYGLDKLKAKRGWSRIPESTLLILALLLGGVGAWLGIYTFRHKTRQKKFVVLVPICIILNFVAMFAMYKLLRG